MKHPVILMFICPRVSAPLNGDLRSSDAGGDASATKPAFATFIATHKRICNNVFRSPILRFP